MKKVRKMLGDAQSPACISMMQLIESQSTLTLSRWALNYSMEHCLPILRRTKGMDTPMEQVLTGVQCHLDGSLSAKDLRPLLKTGREYAASLSDPVSQSAARALSVAAAVCFTPTNALGFLFYLCAAMAYDGHGTDGDKAWYDAFANDEFIRAHGSLLSVSVPDEQNKAHINWNC